jgi:hypothetical protein
MSGARRPAQRAGAGRAAKSEARSTGMGGLLLLAVSVLLALGWSVRGEEYYTAEQGWGYAFGIIGGVMMLVLLLYPLRKRIRVMQALGAVRHWFRGHMLLGVLGPTFILFHCNFSLGSVNSNVALISMVAVALSGVAGRYIYTHLHHGVYGRRATLAELRESLDGSDGAVLGSLAFVPSVGTRLRDFEARALAPATGALRALRLPLLPWQAGRARRAALRDLALYLKTQARLEGWDRSALRARHAPRRALVRRHVALVSQIAAFSAWERMFSWWHVLHIPLFVMLVIAGVVHVIAVHMY